jgi:peptide/nickel transport system permease protein
MAVSTSASTLVVPRFRDEGRTRSVLGYLQRNPQLVAGLLMIGALVLFWSLGSVLVDVKTARPLSAQPELEPSFKYPLGTDTAGRNILAAMIVGTPITLRIGLIAATIGMLIGIVLGFSAGYFGGTADTVIRGITDTILPIPALAVLVVIASLLTKALTPDSMGLIVASLAWMSPTRTIRAQVLTMRERTYVEVARLCGLGGPEIVIRELVPNLLPYLGASFVSAVGGSILAAIGLEALGLGPQNEPTMGMTIFWANYNGAIIRGMWWWWGPPIFVIVFLFVGLFLISAGLDEIANPRLRTRT